MIKRSMRLEYGKHLVEMGKKYPQLVVLEADLKESTQSIQFQQAFPKRYLEVGVAEQNMVGIAAGLALSGKIPITHSFACFTSMRACEQIRTSVAYPKLNVKFLAAHGGLSAGSAGTTHHAIEDIAIMRSIPNVAVLAPGDINEMQQVIEAALNYKGPVYIRLSAQEVGEVFGKNDKFTIGKANELRQGQDATIITTGTALHLGIEAADLLQKDNGIKCRVLQMASVKPIDCPAIIRAAQETDFLITVEEHNVIGGLGSAVCEVVSELGNTTVRRLGINDHFCGVGTHSYLMEEEGLSAGNIVKQVLSLAKKDEKKVKDNLLNIS